MNFWLTIDAHISATLGREVHCREQRTISGGCINTAYVVNDGPRQFFVKTNTHSRASMFAAEAEGLLEIAKNGAIRVPEPLCWGIAADQAYLVLEYIEFGSPVESSHASLGVQLAQLHRVIGPRFGWQRDNTLGTTPQINTYCDAWAAFWGSHRLGYQYRLAVNNGCRGTLITKLEKIIDSVPIILAGHQPSASLLHGDLWGGNSAFDQQGTPLIFDPAVYYGDRETDLAMTELFGGFSPRFYQAYKSEYPVLPGYSVRRILYNLYHVLNHLHLFGGGYASQAEQMTDSLLSEL